MLEFSSILQPHFGVYFAASLALRITVELTYLYRLVDDTNMSFLLLFEKPKSQQMWNICIVY